MNQLMRSDAVEARPVELSADTTLSTTDRYKPFLRPGRDWNTPHRSKLHQSLFKTSSPPPVRTVAEANS